MEMTQSEQLEAVDHSISRAKDQIAMADALGRLYKNRDFKKVFLDGFLNEEAARTVRALANPAMQDAQNQAMLQKQIIAVGQVHQFMLTIDRIGMMARKSLGEFEETREEILREGEEA